MERPLVKEERKPPGTTLLGSVRHFCFHALSRFKGPQTSRSSTPDTHGAGKGNTRPFPVCVYNTAGQDRSRPNEENSSQGRQSSLAGTLAAGMTAKPTTSSVPLID